MTAEPQKLTEKFYAATQVAPAEIPALATAGFDLIICNRPDHEEPGQPFAREIEDAAKAAGIGFLNLPVGAGGITHEDLAALANAIDGKSKVLGFCKSGFRSVVIWAMAMAAKGTSVEQLIQDSRNAGYDISAQRHVLESLNPSGSA